MPQLILNSSLKTGSSPEQFVSGFGGACYRECYKKMPNVEHFILDDSISKMYISSV
jgi:hypothetical protein